MRLQATSEGTTHTIEIDEEGDKSLVRVKIDEREYLVDVTTPAPGCYSLVVDGKVFTARVSLKRGKREVQLGHWSTSIEVGQPRPGRPPAKTTATVGRRQEIITPMSGRVVQVLVQNNDTVLEGACLVIIEAMKMETEIRSPIAGQVRDLHVQAGMAVETAQVLLIVEA